MNVRETVDLGNGHLIEIGDATWDSAETAIRNRYPTSTGGFSPHSSSELPLHDVGPIVQVLAENDLLDASTSARLIELLAASLRRQIGVESGRLETLLAGVTPENIHAEVETGPSVGAEQW